MMASPTWPNVCHRFHAPPTCGDLNALRIERGTFADYAALSQFHYKSGHPGGVMSVFRMVRSAPTVVGRYLHRRDETQVIGVLVRSLPALSCQLRNVATNDRYRNLKPRDAAVMLNREVRTISRVVIDPQWRGLGLAVKLVKHALQHPHDRATCDAAESDGSLHSALITEALAVMGRVSPFFEHAGMTRYDRPPRPEQARLLDALRHLHVEPFMLASIALIHEQIASSALKHFLIAELRRWHRAAHRTPKNSLHAMTLHGLLIAARSELLSQPVYYAFRHETQYS